MTAGCVAGRLAFSHEVRQYNIPLFIKYSEEVGQEEVDKKVYDSLVDTCGKKTLRKIVPLGAIDKCWKKTLRKIVPLGTIHKCGKKTLRKIVPLGTSIFVDVIFCLMNSLVQICWFHELIDAINPTSSHKPQDS